MIPPGGMIQEERVGKTNEAGRRETPESPAGGGQQESKLQRLKRSLSFKAKSLRSKSADNFFQRSSSDVRLQVDLLPEVSAGGLGPAPLPVPGCSPRRLPRPPDGATHSFLEHIFKKPIFCDICNHMIVGTTAKHGLRCKACKMSIHHKCADSVGQQRCMGKLPKGFRRYYSSPLLIQEQFGCIKEVMPIACGSKVDPVYEALRFGTSLAQKTKRTSMESGSESPHRTSTTDLAEVPEEGGSHGSRAELSRKHSDNVFLPLENGTEHLDVGEGSRDESPARRPLWRDDLLPRDAYVALRRFIPQEKQELQIRHFSPKRRSPRFRGAVLAGRPVRRRPAGAEAWGLDRSSRPLQRTLVDEPRGRRGRPRREDGRLRAL